MSRSKIFNLLPELLMSLVKVRDGGAEGSLFNALI